ncbi:hypothetical protein AWR36_008265 [Microbulbifer flavimaris]|uniref:DUF262 domain-containing protein n=1 Tax=Microbulbifer flavimaris TaxID=1781068 RepID=A0ABX4I0P9_9GAMM|nr:MULTISPECIES: DUF262 and DUF1524 domain-containing protein [Microbulbifer]KUJ83803.1 hypothetical protein AVO43_08230 [Microbulbifer sp. ZGT114]PCO05979.1 hypothetical protein AWR36_008265 [Microbulbifer flavimaris]
MKAQDLQFTQLLEGSKQFVIPIFQRAYSWEISQCQQLWDDIVRVGSNPDLNSHFIGSAVYIPETNVDAAIPRWLVIDGQQRITTMTLLLLALKSHLEREDIDEPISAAQLEDYYLKNRYGKGEAAYRMLLTKTDKDSLIRLLDGKPIGDDGSLRIAENYQFFAERIAQESLDNIWKGIKKLMIVDVCLQQGIDNPQMIFESMNSTGKALTQADLIRNYVLMGLEHDLQTRLYEDLWRPMEVEFGAENYSERFDEFMRFYLVIHTGNTRLKKAEVYDQFKAYSRGHEVETLLISLREYASYYCRIALGGEKDPHLYEVFHDIRELRADVTYPFLMEAYKDFTDGLLDHEKFLAVARLVESYVFRRAVCDIPTNSQRQTFATLMKGVDKDQYLESVKASFQLLPSYRRFPKDDEFMRQMQVRNLYKFNRRSYWLRRFENHGRKERVPVNDYTIEHIMPQNQELSAQWRMDLGEDWQRIHEQYLHTLGNLTLTGYNSEYSDKSFKDKRDMDGGFRQSPLRLNEGLGQCEKWSEAAIQARAERLAKGAIQIWAAPNLPAETLQQYRKVEPDTTTYTIDDHQHLQDGRTRELFEILRTRLLQLDECVTESFFKLYVAYKAETNFVDVVPQARGLRISLNMDYPEVDDPRGLCRDVTGVGRWGNGNVEVRLDDPSDLNYVIGLARQSLEKQLGSDE